MESIHPSFSFPVFFVLFCIFYFYRHYYCFVSASGGPHRREVSLLSSLFYSRKTGSWKMRDSMGFTNWIILKISAYNICSNNMYTFFFSMIAQSMSAFRGISSSELGSTQPIPSFLKIIYMQHFHLYVFAKLFTATVFFFWLGNCLLRG